MRVLERGPWEMHVVCPKCHSTLAVEANDVLWDAGRFYAVGDSEYFCRCDVCSERLSLPLGAVPRDIAQRAVANY